MFRKQLETADTYGFSHERQLFWLIFHLLRNSKDYFKKALRQLSVPIFCCTSISICFLVSQSKIATLCPYFCLHSVEGT
jgi:hypothetical protein